MFTSPFYEDISAYRTQVASYNEALDNSKALENERDKLTTKYNAITPGNLDKLSKFLPNNVDNIRLILEIEKLAGPYGMVLKDVKYNAVSTDNANAAPQAGGAVQASEVSPVSNNNNYGSWDLEFSTQGTYANFLNFIKALESNLRIVEISSIEFSSSTASASTGTSGASPTSSDTYRYLFKIKTYWLKN